MFWACCLLYCIPRSLKVPVGSRHHDATADTFPLTWEQTNAQIEEFIDSISEEAICDLASRYRGQGPCTVVGRDRGSFNVCFFVRFDTDTDHDHARWVVRVPLEPVVVDSWAKTQSEVATLRQASIFLLEITAEADSNLLAASSETAPRYPSRVSEGLAPRRPSSPAALERRLS